MSLLFLIKIATISEKKYSHLFDKDCHNVREEILVGNLTKSRFCPSLLAEGFQVQLEFHFLATVATAIQRRTSRDMGYALTCENNCVACLLVCLLVFCLLHEV